MTTTPIASHGVRAMLMALLFLGSEQCVASPDQPIKGHVLDVGIVRPVGQQRSTADAGSATGFVTHGDATFQEHTTFVPLIKGTAFGVAYRLTGLPLGKTVRLTQVIEHPPMRKPDGAVIHQQVSYQNVTSPSGSIEGKLWYILRQDHELVPGGWTVILLHGNTVLFKQGFKVQDAL